jgi:hypothetical protein
MPTLVAGVAVWCAAIPTIVFSSRHKVRGVRSLISVLLLLWIHLTIGYAWFHVFGDRVQGYVWTLHAAAQVLISWQPRHGTLVCQWAQPLWSVVGALCVAMFAWQSGPYVGLILYRSDVFDHCGWIAHLHATLGVDLVTWLYWPIGRAVVEM